MQVLGVRDVTLLDIIYSHILPAFRSGQARGEATLVSYLALIARSGLLTCAKFNARFPDSMRVRSC